MQETFRGRGLLRALFLVPYALPVYAAVITWAFMFQRDNGLINHVLHDQLGLTDSRHVLADRRQQLRRAAHRLGVEGLAVRLPDRHGRAAEHPPRDVRGRGHRRRRGCGSRSAASRCPRCGRSTRCSSWSCSCGRSTTSTRRTSCSASRHPRRRTSISIHIYQSSFATWNFGTGSAMSVLLLLFLLAGDGRLPAGHLTREGRPPMPSARTAARPVTDGAAPLLPLVPADLPDPAHRLRPAARVRDGVQLAQAARGRVGQVPLDAQRAHRPARTSTSGRPSRWRSTS